MRLGIDTTSYRNYRLSQADPLDPEPALGMGVTILGRASRRPGTVVELRTDAEKLIVIVQEDQVVSGVDALRAMMAKCSIETQRAESIAFFEQRPARGNVYATTPATSDGHRAAPRA